MRWALLVLVWMTSLSVQAARYVFDPAAVWLLSDSKTPNWHCTATRVSTQWLLSDADCVRALPEPIYAGWQRQGRLELESVQWVAPSARHYDAELAWLRLPDLELLSLAQAPHWSIAADLRFLEGADTPLQHWGWSLISDALAPWLTVANSQSLSCDGLCSSPPDDRSSGVCLEQAGAPVTVEYEGQIRVLGLARQADHCRVSAPSQYRYINVSGKAPPSTEQDAVAVAGNEADGGAGSMGGMWWLLCLSACWRRHCSRKVVS